jgi:hypothetical protein
MALNYKTQTIASTNYNKLHALSSPV